MKRYQEERERQTKRATVTGLVMTGVIHGAALVIGLSAGLKYLYPPPPETSFLVDFSEDPFVRPVRAGNRPQAQNVVPDAPVELTRSAESPYEDGAAHETPEAGKDDFGDVETPEPPAEEPPKLDPRASFPGMAANPSSSTAPHAAPERAEQYKEGQVKGNTAQGRTSGTANAHLKGRSVLGNLPIPAYGIQKEGIVVVQIKVDQYGNVTEAVAGAEGTTVTDMTLWNAARRAALGAHFNPSADAPLIQVGTITYIFKLT